jgi:hypothetical protein
VLRAVLDTNVFISSLLSRQGPPAQVLDAWRSREYLLLTSPEIIAETAAVLQSPHLRDKYSLSQEDVDQFLVLLRQDALVVPGVTDVSGAVPADPQDEIFLACAPDGQADVIVSGDKHLLELGEYQGIPILTVRRFLHRLSEG